LRADVSKSAGTTAMVDETVRRLGVPNIVYIDSSRAKAHCLFRRPKGGPFMSRVFGEMRQIAFVVRDLEKALDYWTRTLGVGHPHALARDGHAENIEVRGSHGGLALNAEVYRHLARALTAS
jgi:hypothetical protein